MGMTFFADVAPVVDWRKKTVVARGVSLPVQCFSADVHKSDLGADVHTNKFAVLNVEVGADGVSAVPAVPVVAQPVGENVCGGVCCWSVRKDSDQLMHAQNANV